MPQKIIMILELLYNANNSIDIKQNTYDIYANGITQTNIFSEKNVSV